MRRALLMGGSALAPLAVLGPVPAVVPFGLAAAEPVRVTGGRNSGKTERQRRLAGLRSDTIPRVICPA